MEDAKYEVRSLRSRQTSELKATSLKTKVPRVTMIENKKVSPILPYVQGTSGRRSQPYATVGPINSAHSLFIFLDFQCHG